MAQMALLAAGTAASVAGSMMAGREQSRAAAFEEQQYKAQAQQYRTAAAQDEAKRRTELAASLDTIMALRAGRGVGQASPTGTTILEDITAGAESDIQTSKANLLGKADQARIAGDMSAHKRRMALIAGDLGAIEKLATSGLKLKNLKMI